MLRGLLLFIAFLFIYSALKTVFRSARRAYREEEPPRRIKGEEMVLDPLCKTYVVKDRAVTRRIRGAVHSFCSEECARRYEDTSRG